MNRATTAEPAVNTVVVNDPLLALAQNVDLETVLAAWHTATLRLERTHETLCGEVARLTKELEIKNRELAQRTVWPTSGRWLRTLPTRCATTWFRFHCM